MDTRGRERADTTLPGDDALVERWTAARKEALVLKVEGGGLPLNERSGPLLGETCAKMRESCIISLADFASAADERRFMLGFLSALYRHANGEPVHLVVDEADLWAPQLILDKDGDAPKLLGQMNTIVRRGRIKGFIPWLITQRPAEISKGVLSHADGLLAFTLTSSQDRDAIGGWIKGQADAEAGRAILASLPSLQLGQGVIWIPRRGILETAQFPKKATFDSSRTPKRGEVVRAAALKPLDLGVLKERLVAVEQEAKANDPKVLKAEIARLSAELRKPTAAPVAPGPTPAEIEQIRQSDYIEGVVEGEKRGNPAGQALMLTRVRNALDGLRVDIALEPSITPAKTYAGQRPPSPVAKPVAPPSPRPRPQTSAPANAAGGEVSAPIRKLLNAIAWWGTFGLADPTANQVGFIAGYSPTAGTFRNYRSAAKTQGLIHYPRDGRMALIEAGAELADQPDAAPTQEALHDAVRANIEGPLVRLLDPLLRAYPEALNSELVAAEAGYEPTAGTFRNYRSRLKTLEIIEYPGAGLLRAAGWLFPGEMT